MNEKQKFTLIDISDADRDRFRRIVIDVMSEACAMPDGEDGYDGIGRLAEKQMHAAIKRLVCPDVSRHEIKIDGSALCIAREISDGSKKIKEIFVNHGCEFLSDSPTNQQFPILKNSEIAELRKIFSFETWCAIDENTSAVRFCSSWATTEENIQKLKSAVESL